MNSNCYFYQNFKKNHQPDATIFQFIILTFIHSSTRFGRFPAHHQELNDCSGSLWFYLRIVVTVVPCSWSGRPVALSNKRHFEEKNGERAACLKYSVLIFVGKKYIKCNIWRVAVGPSYIWDARFLKVKSKINLLKPTGYVMHCQV